MVTKLWPNGNLKYNLITGIKKTLYTSFLTSRQTIKNSEI